MCFINNIFQLLPRNASKQSKAHLWCVRCCYRRCGSSRSGHTRLQCGSHRRCVLGPQGREDGQGANRHAYDCCGADLHRNDRCGPNIKVNGETAPPHFFFGIIEYILQQN